jgi:hypothetical protein
MSWWVDPRVLLEGSPAARGLVLGLWLVLCAGGFLHAFAWRFGFCRSACPIGLYYRYVTSKTPVGIVFSEQPSPCIGRRLRESAPSTSIRAKLGDTTAAGCGPGRAADRRRAPSTAAESSAAATASGLPDDLQSRPAAHRNSAGRPGGRQGPEPAPDAWRP